MCAVAIWCGGAVVVAAMMRLERDAVEDDVDRRGKDRMGESQPAGRRPGYGGRPTTQQRWISGLWLTKHRSLYSTDGA